MLFSEAGIFSSGKISKTAALPERHGRGQVELSRAGGWLDRLRAVVGQSTSLAPTSSFIPPGGSLDSRPLV